MRGSYHDLKEIPVERRHFEETSPDVSFRVAKTARNPLPTERVPCNRRGSRAEARDDTS
jgi:hypothetical protein